MPSYVAHIGLPNYMFGFFFAFMSLGTMLGGPFWGNLGDKGKKRMVVIAGLLIYAVNQALFGMGHVFDEWSLSLFRFLSGFGIAATFTVLGGEIIIVSKPESRARSIAYGAASVALGGAIGQFLGGFIHTNDFLYKSLEQICFTTHYTFKQYSY